MNNSYWQIDGVNEIFRTLKDAKHHIWFAYTPAERIKYLSGSSITHWIGEEIVSTVAITLRDAGTLTHYGKVTKLDWWETSH